MEKKEQKEKVKSEVPNPGKGYWKKMKKWKKFLLILGILAAVCVAAFCIYKWIVRTQMDEETKKRDSWSVETGEWIETNREQRVDIYESAEDSQISVYQIVPREAEKDSFTYYNIQVQDRLADTLEDLKAAKDYTLGAPLAVWNPFGTGSNGLYIYFQYDGAAELSYTIHVDDPSIEDYTAQANIEAGDSLRGAAAGIEFLMIGLVPGRVNEVTMQVYDDSGSLMDDFTFEITAPETISGYEIKLESTRGISGEALSDGLYYTLGTQGYYGYMFFFDNQGVMRYEMLLDGYKADRMIMDGDEMICCVSSDQIGKINRLGRVTRIYTLDGYVMHHDFNRGRENCLLVLATRENAKNNAVMDRVVEINMETGAVEELVNLQDIFHEYYVQTDTVSETDPFFWQAGTRDWIHVNTIDTLGEDSIILSSRETSTIIKLSDIYGEPELEWLIGDESYWDKTAYEDFCLSMDGGFTPQYGQHTVTVMESEDLEEGRYYLMMYNNNYYANSTRTDGYEPQLDDQVSQALSDDRKASYVYFYLVDENAGTYSLEWSFEVPYSSIVSSVQLLDENYVVNSGVAKTFGEYDSQGRLIRSFAYDTTFQGYRVMKDDFSRFWFK